MKKIIFVFVLFFISIFCFSQARIGISTYVYPGSIGVRWANLEKYTSDGMIFTKTTFEFRTAFAASFSGEGNVVMIQPELNALFSFSRYANISLMSGVGVAFGYQNENDNFWGAYIPLVTEFQPLPCKGYFSIKIEGDVFYKKYPNFSSINFRPLVGVVYNFRRPRKIVDATQ